MQEEQRPCQSGPAPRGPGRTGHPGLCRACGAGVWRALTIACCVLATLFTAPAPAQVMAGFRAAPGPSETFDAYRTLESWVRAWEVPGGPDEPQFTDPSGAAGACVTLLLGGELIGRAVSMRTDGGAVWEAARGAVAEADARLPIERDALRREAALDVAQRIQIDLEIAGTPVPTLGATYDDAGAQVAPGLEGVAVRAGEALAAVFPGAMLGANLAPAGALRAACTEAGLPPLPLDRLLAEHGALVYRFPVRRLTQTAPGGEPQFLFRGGRVLDQSQVAVSTLLQTAEGVSRRLISLAWPGEEPHGMFGDYEAWTDRFEPPIASRAEQAIVAYALFRYASTPGVGAAESTRAARFAWSLADAAQRAHGSGEWDPAADRPACAAWTIALLENVARPPGMPPGADRDGPLARACRAAVLDDAGGAPLPERALRAFALARLAAADPEDSALRARAEEDVRSLFIGAAPGELVSATPWIGWAELTLAGPSGEIPAALALEELRSLVWSRQVGPDRAEAVGPDLVGGIEFAGGRGPTWQSCRPVALLATMLGDERLTPPPALGREAAATMRALRFVSQLVVDESVAGTLPDRDRSLGGVRDALWTARLGVDTQAAALLAITEALRSVDAVAARRAVR